MAAWRWRSRASLAGRLRGSLAQSSRGTSGDLGAASVATACGRRWQPRLMGRCRSEQARDLSRAERPTQALPSPGGGCDCGPLAILGPQRTPSEALWASPRVHWNRRGPDPTRGRRPPGDGVFSVPPTRHRVGLHDGPYWPRGSSEPEAAATATSYAPSAASAALDAGPGADVRRLRGVLPRRGRRPSPAADLPRLSGGHLMPDQEVCPPRPAPMPPWSQPRAQNPRQPPEISQKGPASWLDS